MRSSPTPNLHSKHMKLRGYSLFFNFSHWPEIEDEGTRAGTVRRSNSSRGRRAAAATGGASNSTPSKVLHVCNILQDCAVQEIVRAMELAGHTPLLAVVPKARRGRGASLGLIEMPFGLIEMPSTTDAAAVIARHGPNGHDAIQVVVARPPCPASPSGAGTVVACVRDIRRQELQHSSLPPSLLPSDLPLYLVHISSAVALPPHAFVS